MNSYPRVVLRPGREKSLLNRHPWVFSGAVESEPTDAPHGAVVDVLDAQGRFLGRGTYNYFSQIRVRVYTFRDEPLDEEWFGRRLRDAESWRRALLPPDTDAYRVLFGEEDGVPGLIVDRYDDGLVATFATAGADFLRPAIIAALIDACRPAWIMERSTGGYRKEEGVPPRVESVYGDAPAGTTPIRENGLRFLVDVRAGQKTGFFLDQRASRQAVRDMAHGRTVLNAFGYTGAFAVYALDGGARRAVTVDLSADALDLAAQNHELNGQFLGPEDLVAADVFEYLREDDTPFDLIVLDPPAFAKSKAALTRAARGYKDINMLALRRLPPGGLLFTFSCSGHVDWDLHRKILYSAALDAGREVQILRLLGHGLDHPLNVYHPEGEYLTGFICRVGG
jgi:23S rRNA (cytosine1962-C5)-methyltransferase